MGGLRNYLSCKGIPSLANLIGGAKNTVVGHQGIERDIKLLPVFDLDSCNGCGRCYISCMDGGHQAITFDMETRTPKLLGSKCVGCHLCRMVCPTEAIDVAPRILKVKA